MRGYWLQRKPLTDEEKQLLIDNGWAFLNENYIYNLSGQKAPTNSKRELAGHARSLRSLR